MTTFNLFVTAQLHPDILIQAQEHLPQYRAQVQAEKRRIMEYLLTLSGPRILFAERTAAVQRLQAEISRQLDTLHLYRQCCRSLHAAMKAPATDHFYAWLEECWHEVLTALEQHFSECLAPALVPYSYAQQARRHLHFRLRELEVWLDRRQADAVLRDLALRPVRDFIRHTEQQPDFLRLLYLRELTSRLYVLLVIKELPPAHTDRYIHRLLLQANFNAMEYFAYCTGRVRASLKQYDQLGDRLTCLSWYIREVKRMPRKTGRLALDPGGCSIVAQLHAWLEEERIVLRHLHASGSEARRQRHTPAPAQTSLTLPQAALLLRLFVEEGLVRTLPVQQLRRFLETMFRPGMPLDEDTVDNRYRHSGLSTITACKHWLARLTARLQEHENWARTCTD
ncbi:hypothetical protein ACWKWU_18545 [Chitinophaga lutea]